MHSTGQKFYDSGKILQQNDCSVYSVETTHDPINKFLIYIPLKFMIIEIDFLPTWCNGNMLFTVEINGDSVANWTSDLPCGLQNIRCEHDVDVNQPFHMRFIMQGKDQTNDTKLIDGAIVQDKSIEIEKLAINGIDVTQTIFLHNFVIQDGTNITRSKYFGFNGIMDLFIEPNLFVWLQDCETKLTMYDISNNDHA